jgi:hypothetical protein
MRKSRYRWFPATIMWRSRGERKPLEGVAVRSKLDQMMRRCFAVGKKGCFVEIPSLALSLHSHSSCN